MSQTRIESLMVLVERINGFTFQFQFKRKYDICNHKNEYDVILAYFWFTKWEGQKKLSYLRMDST